jgi:hypothetical protein
VKFSAHTSLFLGQDISCCYGLQFQQKTTLTFASLFKCRYVVHKSTHQIPEIPAIKYLESANCVFQTHQYFGHRSHTFYGNSTIFIYFSQVIQSANICHSYQEKTKIATIIQKQDLMLLEEGLPMESHSFGS